MSETNWYVVTGAPSSGKTTLVAALEEMGYRVIHEVARAYIEMQMAQGKTLLEIRADKKSFETWILNKKLSIEDGLPRDDLIILDRAVPDSIAYFEEAGIDSGEALRKSPRNRYKRVFLLDRLPYQDDHARIENHEIAGRLEQGLEKSYRLLGYDVVRVGVMSVADRVKFIVDRIESL